MAAASSNFILQFDSRRSHAHQVAEVTADSLETV